MSTTCMPPDFGYIDSKYMPVLFFCLNCRRLELISSVHICGMVIKTLTDYPLTTAPAPPTITPLL
jgi:hypothetical protein